MTEQTMLADSSGSAQTPPDELAVQAHFPAQPSRALEIATASASLVFAVLALVLSRNINLRLGGGGLDPKWWPTVLSGVAICLSAVLLGFSLLRAPAMREDLESSHRAGWVRVLSTLALTAIYLFAWGTIGYVVPTVLYLAALLWIFQLRDWRGLTIFPALTTVFIYGLFQILLKVPL